MMRRTMMALLALAGTAAQAQTAFCPASCTFGADLVEPHEIRANAQHVLDTTFRVESKPQCVPVWVQNNNVWTCTMTPMELRSYGYPSQSGYIFGFPGPTLRARRAGTYKDPATGKPVELPGDRIKVLLVNALKPESSSHQCNPCDCTQSPQPKCCQEGTFKDVYPDCFHGDNATNLHFHGTHVSPQSPQDYILLELLPEGSGTAGTAAHSRGQTVVGSFQYNVDPLRKDQPEGTHWYHPHKHGSVALQVGGGMAGALIIEGPFDQQVASLFPAPLDEKLLVVQQLHSLNFTAKNPITPQPLVNGQAAPTIKMKPGQIQRWRVVGATMEGAAQITIDFNGPQDDTNVAARQIAMDGVQLAPENYGRQPLLSGGLQQFNLSPGNRADFLVQAPNVPGRYSVTYDIFGRIENSERRHQMRSLLEAIAPGVDQPTLITVEVVPCDGCQPMAFPTQQQWPSMPAFLRDIEKAEIVPPARNLTFAMLDQNGNPPNGPGSLPSKFYVNLGPNERRQYNPNCVDITTKLGTAEEWTITNNMNIDPFHVFHIHTNPFQIIRNGATTFQPPYIWQDSITLPASTAGSIVMRQRYETFTGEYVLHCHFLGHEDRGMMLGVQTVCPNKPDSFGKPNLNGEECVEGSFIPAAPQCPSISTAATTTSSGHGH